MKLFCQLLVVLLPLSLLVDRVHAASLQGAGLSPRAAALAGASVAGGEGPLDAFTSNPATLGLLGARLVDLNLTTGFAQGQFTNAVSDQGRLSPRAGIMPYGAASLPLGASRFRLGASVTPESLMTAKWRYLDPTGAAGASYGLQTNESSLLALRLGVGLGACFTSRFCLGGTVGAVYNSNTLHAPYIFQTNPTLRGLKTLLDLHTTGVGWNSSIGALLQPTRKLRLGVAYKSRTRIHTEGNASGDLASQFAALGVAAPSTFHYQAAVDNVLPQSVLAGASWQAHRRLRLALQADWINWGSAFSTLPVTLTGGTNQVVNSILGSTTLIDAVPLHWRDQIVARIGAETPLGESAYFRAGYAGATNPVPRSTLTPLTAAILRQTVSTGVGLRRGRAHFDFTYAFDLPAEARVSQSALSGGEYNNSRVRVMVHTLSCGTSFRF